MWWSREELLHWNPQRDAAKRYPVVSIARHAPLAPVTAGTVQGPT